MIPLIVLRHKCVTRLHIATRQRLRQRRRRNGGGKTFTPLRRQRSKYIVSFRGLPVANMADVDPAGTTSEDGRATTRWKGRRREAGDQGGRSQSEGGRRLICRRAHVAITVALRYGSRPPPPAGHRTIETRRRRLPESLRRTDASGEDRRQIVSISNRRSSQRQDSATATLRRHRQSQRRSQ